jgi:DNA-binding transcriptional ArsR family regulator
MNINDREGRVDEVAALMKALSSRTRLLILCALADHEHSVGDLALRLGTRSAAVSQHLARLRHDGLVSARRVGQSIHYSLARADIRALIEFLDSAICPSGDATERPRGDRHVNP